MMEPSYELRSQPPISIHEVLEALNADGSRLFDFDYQPQEEDELCLFRRAGGADGLLFIFIQGKWRMGRHGFEVLSKKLGEGEARRLDLEEE